MVHVAVAGEASTLPAASRARTLNVCEPTARFAGENGDVQAAQAAPSSEQSNAVTPTLSVPAKVSVASVAVVVADGADTMLVSGAVVSVVGAGRVPGLAGSSGSVPARTSA